MIQLHNLPKTTQNKAKRLGRGIGSGKGLKSTRGTTRHQAAREDIPSHFEGGQNRLVKKFPYLRGKGRNKSVLVKNSTITFHDLESWNPEIVVDELNLLENGILKFADVARGVKLLADGEPKSALQVKIPASKAAIAKIEKKSGKMIV